MFVIDLMIGNMNCEPPQLSKILSQQNDFYFSVIFIDLCYKKLYSAIGLY